MPITIPLVPGCPTKIHVYSQSILSGRGRDAMGVCLILRPNFSSASFWLFNLLDIWWVLPYISRYVSLPPPCVVHSCCIRVELKKNHLSKTICQRVEAPQQSANDFKSELWQSHSHIRLMTRVNGSLPSHFAVLCHIVLRVILLHRLTLPKRVSSGP